VAAGNERPGDGRRPEEDVVTEQRRPAIRARARLALRLAGGGLLVATAAIHLDLYVTGYRSIPTIGWLFLLQVIAAFGLGVAVLATGHWLAAAAGAGFALATLGGYLLSLWIGLFGFKEVRTTAGIVAGVIEVAAFAALAVLAGLAAAAGGAGGRSQAAPGGAGGRLLAGLQAGVPGTRVVAASVATVSVAALAVLGASVAAANGPGATAAGGSLKTTHIGGVTVLTNAKGFTLYWFAPDTATKSACYGTCAAYWPPVRGAATAGPGVTGRLGTITRSDGPVQATYDGHPLYTYVGDTGAGQANGNRLNLNGGLWYEVTPSG
jgi:predicted lipoprotein with Yx(FWY)xxD motif